MESLSPFDYPIIRIPKKRMWNILLRKMATQKVNRLVQKFQLRI